MCINILQCSKSNFRIPEPIHQGLWIHSYVRGFVDANPFLPFSTEQRPMTLLRFSLTDHRIRNQQVGRCQKVSGGRTRSIVASKKGGFKNRRHIHLKPTTQMPPTATLQPPRAAPPRTSRSSFPLPEPPRSVQAACGTLSRLGNKLISAGRATSYRQ